LYGTSVLAAGKRSELDESIVVCQRAALARARAADEGGGHRDLVRAVIAVERSRARWLGEMLAQDQTQLVTANADTLGANAVARYKKAALRMRELEADERRLVPPVTLGTGRDDEALARTTDGLLSAQLGQAHTELQAAIEGVRALGDEFATFLKPPGFATVAEALDPAQALAYVLVTAHDSLALLVHRPSQGPPVVKSVSAALTSRELATMLLLEGGSGGYLPAQAYAPESLSEVLEVALPALGDRLIAPIARQLRELGADAVTLVPCGLLGTLPLHAASYMHNGVPCRLIDELDVSYSPSARVLSTARVRLEASPGVRDTLAGVGNPTVRTNPLRYAELELQSVAAHFSDPRPLIGANATAAAVTRAAKDAAYVHLACHGEFDVADPLGSGLELADGRLSIREILETHPFAAARLVVPSACKSAVFEVTDLPDEVVGLPTGILCGGTPGVVGTLWSVDDRSTAILMSQFYTFHLRGDPSTGEPPMAPAHALRKVQRWLSTATSDDLAAANLRRHQAEAESPDEVSPGGTAPSSDGIVYPYADPYYWAAFVFLGT